MSIEKKTVIIQWMCHAVTLPAIFYSLYSGKYYLLGISLVMYVIIGMFGVNIALHRLLSHRSFKTYPWIEKTITYISVLATIGPTIAWVAMHRAHHHFCDKEGDPHTPYVDGKFSYKKALKIWTVYDWNIGALPITYVKDLLRGNTHKFIYKHYFKILYVYWFILILINPILWVYMYAVPVSMILNALACINILGHWHGYRNYETNDKSTNSWIANIIVLGDGWHNTHHARPKKWYLKENWWEWDPSGEVIKLIKID